MRRRITPPPLCLVPASATGNRLVRRHARVACFYQVMRNRPKIGRCLLCQCEPASPRCSSTRERTAVPFAHAASDCACLGCLGWRCLGRLGCPATALRPPPPRLAAPDLGARAARGTLGRAQVVLLRGVAVAARTAGAVAARAGRAAAAVAAGRAGAGAAFRVLGTGAVPAAERY